MTFHCHPKLVFSIETNTVPTSLLLIFGGSIIALRRVTAPAYHRTASGTTHYIELTQFAQAEEFYSPVRSLLCSYSATILVVASLNNAIE